MNRTLQTALGVAVVAWGVVASGREAPRQEAIPEPCVVVPAPSSESLHPYRRRGPYARAANLFARGRFSDAARQFSSAWRRVQADLGKVFLSSSCDSARIRAVLTKSLFHDPPLAIPGDDRFLPPQAVRDAWSHALCASGRVREAAEVLLEAALAGDDQARAAAGVLLAASGQAAMCLALLPETTTSAILALSKAFCLVHAGRVSEAETTVSRARDGHGPMVDALRNLLRATDLTAPEGP